MSGVILSGFADEASRDKGVVEQFAVMAALGLKYFSIRFIDAGHGVKNVMKLTPAEVDRVVQLKADYGLQVASLGSPLGKVKLRSDDDSTTNAYVPFDVYLREDVPRACDLANQLGTRLIRGFSFYHPKGTDPHPHLDQAADQLTAIAEVCGQAGLTYGLEIEANLIGQTGQLMAELHRRVHHPAMVLVFDAGNILCQGYSAAEVFEQYVAMKPGLGWLHIKDYLPPQAADAGASAVGAGGRHVNEEMLKHFVPADLGGSGHEAILRDLCDYAPQVARRMSERGVPGVFLDLEPHVKGGGQFGGFSGPDGLGVALRGLCRLLDHVGLGYHLRDFDDIRASRGF
ncbi:MAG: TIM barrel protein [Pirellulales bacterium]